MTMRVLRKRSRTKAQNRPTPPLALTLRADVPLGAGPHALYADLVAEGKINRDAWARQVDALIKEETGGKKATFARRVGVDPRTISRWLNSEVDVSEASVRGVALALNRPAVSLLVAVGYYRYADLSPAQQLGQETDPLIHQIMAADVPDDRKQRMLDRLHALRAAQAKREADEVQWWIDEARGA